MGSNGELSVILTMPAKSYPWKLSSSRPRKRRFFFVFLVVHALLLSPTSATPACDGRGKSNLAKHSKFSYPSILDDLVKGYTESKDLISTQLLSEDDGAGGFMRNLWSAGKRRSAALLQGVRRGGALSSINDLGGVPFGEKNSIDRLAESYSLAIAWVVALQASFMAIISHRRSLFELATRIVKSDTIAAVRTIQSILESVDDHGVIDVFKKYPTKDLIASIYALSRLQAATEYCDHGKVLSGKYASVDDFPLLEDGELLDELSHYAPFASAAYGWKLDLATAGRLHRGDLHALTRMTKISPEDVVKVEWEARANRPAYYIVRDRKRKNIVLAIRGTWSAHDILTDLCCTPEEYFVRSKRKKHRAHNGMLAAARGVISMAEETIEKELDDHPDYSLVLVGHSLGGSVAAVVGQLWADTFRGVRVYVYGPACVAPMDDIDKNLVVSVLLEGDPFSSLSLGHVADTSCALAHLCDDEDLRTNILTVTDGSIENMDKADLAWCKAKMGEIREHMIGEKMYPPGRLLFVEACDGRKGSPVIRDISTTFYNELRIGARMFDLSRHVPRVYQRRLKNALRHFKASPRGS